MKAFSNVSVIGRQYVLSCNADLMQGERFIVWKEREIFLQFSEVSTIKKSTDK